METARKLVSTMMARRPRGVSAGYRERPALPFRGSGKPLRDPFVSATTEPSGTAYRRVLVLIGPAEAECQDVFGFNHDTPV
jgi:hypothetical protein